MDFSKALRALEIKQERQKAAVTDTGLMINAIKEAQANAEKPPKQTQK